MERKNLKLFIILLLLLLPIVLIVLVRNFLSTNYLASSIYKLIFISPLFYRLFIRKRSLKDSITEGFNFKKFKDKFWIVIGVGILLSIIYFSAYFVFKGYLNLESIGNNLDQLASINATNIIFIGVYIVFINSLLEEFFWRGFIFKETNKLMTPLLTYLITGIAFSFHHVMFYYTWFSFPLFSLVTIGLVGFAVIVNFIFQQYEDLYSCWLIHGMVDIVQITIAIMIFGII
jgi:membrane protease YdiL (CAAX protease family)